MTRHMEFNPFRIGIGIALVLLLASRPVSGAVPETMSVPRSLPGFNPCSGFHRIVGAIVRKVSEDELLATDALWRIRHFDARVRKYNDSLDLPRQSPPTWSKICAC